MREKESRVPPINWQPLPHTRWVGRVILASLSPARTGFAKGDQGKRQVAPGATRPLEVSGSDVSATT